jgi:hypothetical protein
MTLNMRTYVQAAAKSNKNPTSERRFSRDLEGRETEIQQIQREEEVHLDRLRLSAWNLDDTLPDAGESW